MLGGHSRILVADDSVASCGATHQALHSLGYRLVDYVPDSNSALRLIEQKNYSLVLAEWDTDRIKGNEILHKIRTHNEWRCLPFLMVIPRWQRKFIEIVREDGATLYVTRPFTPHILGERMLQVDRDAGRLRTSLTHRSQDLAAASKTSGGPSDLWRLLRPDVFAT